jgi:hypothetical protein
VHFREQKLQPETLANLYLAFRVLRSVFCLLPFAFSIRHSAFGVRRSAFSIRHSAFGVQRSAFSIRRSAFGVQHSAFGVLQRTYHLHIFFGHSLCPGTLVNNITPYHVHRKSANSAARHYPGHRQGRFILKYTYQRRSTGPNTHLNSPQ